MLLNWSTTLAWAAILGSLVPATASPSAVFGRKAATLSSIYVQGHNASSSDITAARQIIKDALAKDAELNTARVKSPARNHFSFRTRSKVGQRDSAEEVPPLLKVTDEIAAAAALLTTLESGNSTNTNATAFQKRGSSWWMEGLDHKGSVPLGDDTSYKVFRNVVDYGADPTGAKDSSAAIQKAISDGKRCGEKCNGSTTKNAIVYFPSGTYTVSRSIAVYFGTQLIGDANNRPTIKASQFHLGLGVFSTDVYVPNGGDGPDGNALEWYINTARFYSQIRNLIVDVRGARTGSKKAAFHYQVAQATTIENIDILADSNTDQQGIFAENGSGGVMSDITIKACVKDLEGDGKQRIRKGGKEAAYGLMQDICPAYEWLIGRLEEAKLDADRTPEPAHFRTNINLAWAKLNKYYSTIDQSPAYYAATVLHPAIRWDFLRRAYRERPEWIEKAQQLLRDIWQEYKKLPVQFERNLFDDVRPVKRAKEAEEAVDTFSSYLDSFKSTAMEISREGTDDELDRWLHLADPVEKDCDPFLYWFNKRFDYPRLTRMAIDILSVPPMAAECERVFSSCGNMVSAKRCRLQAETIAITQTVRSWLRAGLLDDYDGLLKDLVEVELDETLGLFGIYGGSQQFSASRMTFDGCRTAVQLIWDWGWLWKKTTVRNANVGFRLYNNVNQEIPGSATFVDSVFENISDASILMDTPKDGQDKGFTGLVLDNVKLGAAVKDFAFNEEIVASGYQEHYVIGATYKDNKRSFTQGSMPYQRQDELLGGSWGGLEKNVYFDRPRNQYTDKSASDFIHVKSNGAKGDGSSDDTAALQRIFDANASNGKVIYIDAGTYIITDTLTVPNGALIVGETWSQLAAKGDKFGDAQKPAVMLRVGKEGDIGSVEMQDLILTSIGPTPGVVLMEWNIAADKPGSAALWDVHARLGGATGTGLTPKECPPSTSGTNSPKCQVAAMMLHVTKEASGYFDNMWLWVADHMIDDPLMDDATNNMDQLSVYCARGMLIESIKATWLYGTASEHSTFYQYNFHHAENIYTTYLQTESAYYQPTPPPPAPFRDAVGVFTGDPGYECKDKSDAASGCDESWAVIMEGSQNIHMGAAGTYSWFSTYSQTCVDASNCQKSLWYLKDNYENNRFEQVIAIGAENIFVDASSSGKTINSKDNLAVTKHPKWSHVAVYDVLSGGEKPNDNPCDRGYKTWTKSEDDLHIPLLALLNDNRGEGTKLRAPDRNGSGSAAPAAITIVNMTPYKLIWRDERPHPYQIQGSFVDVPSGRASTMNCTYTQNSSTSYPDSKGYFKYDVGDTDKYFWVFCGTHVPTQYDQIVQFQMGGMGKADKEFVVPANGQPVTLVITGSEDYGDYHVSTQFADYNWMNMIRKSIENRQLRHVVLPGSHDAGMSSITEVGWNGGGIVANTETQTLDHYNQLRVGIRDFDVRIVTVNQEKFYAAHVNDERSANAVGATGVSLQDMIDGVNRFTASYPGEIIIWRVRSMVNYGDGDHFWNGDLYNKFYDKLTEINNRCTNLESGLETQKIGKLMAKNAGKGCVILLTSRTGGDNNGLLQHRADLGIYNSTWLWIRGYWAEEASTRRIVPKLVTEMNKWSRDVNATPANGPYGILQWQTTNLWFPLQQSACSETNPALYSIGFNYMSPTFFPSVILQDAVGLTVSNRIKEQDYNPRMQTLAIGLNLYMVSQNCDASPDRSPLQRKK